MKDLGSWTLEKENQRQHNRHSQEDRKCMKSTSTHQHTHQIESQDNLHVFRLESEILELQKKIDQQ